MAVESVVDLLVELLKNLFLRKQREWFLCTVIPHKDVPCDICILDCLPGGMKIFVHDVLFSDS